MRLLNVFAASVLVLASACFATAAVTNVKAVQVEQTAVDGFIANEILIDFEGNLRGQQMILNLTAGSIYQDGLGSNLPSNSGFWGPAPTLRYDTYVAIGGRQSDGAKPPATQEVLLVGGAANLEPGAVLKFDTEGLNVAWAPGTGVDVPNGTDYITSQITLSNDAVGTLQYFGSTSAGTGDPFMTSFDILNGVIGGDTGVDPVVGDLNLVTTLLNEVVSGQVALTDVDGLAFDDINNPVFTPLIAGKTLELDKLPTLDDAGNFSWDTSGAKRGTYAWAITGTGAGGATDAGLISVEVTQVPEPATFALVGMALVGFVGAARRRS